MELNEIISRIEETTDQLEVGENSFYSLFHEYCNADDTDKTVCAIKLWLHMQDAKYIPEDLDSDDDSALADMLIAIGGMLGQPEPIEYALVLMHHRFMLGDYLEKAFISKLFYHCLTKQEKLVREIVDDFIDSTQGDSFYTEVMDVQDLDKDDPFLPLELERAIIHPLIWLKETYPQMGDLSELLSEDYLQAMSEYEECCKECKPAINKLTALCSFLNEKIHK